MAKKRKVWPWVVGGLVVVGGGLAYWYYRKKKQKQTGMIVPAAAAGGTLPYVPGGILPEFPGLTELPTGWPTVEEAAAAGAPAREAATTPPKPVALPKYQQPEKVIGFTTPAQPLAFIARETGTERIGAITQYGKLAQFAPKAPPELRPYLETPSMQLVPATTAGGEFMLVQPVRTKGGGGGRLVAGEIWVNPNTGAASTAPTPSTAAKQTSTKSTTVSLAKPKSTEIFFV